MDDVLGFYGILWFGNTPFQSVGPSTDLPRPTSAPMFQFRKHWCQKVTKVGYRSMD